MPARGFVVPEDTLRWGAGRTMRLQAGWMAIVGSALLILPSSRFTTPSWQFVQAVPGGDNAIGAAYLCLATVMAAGLVAGHQQWMAISLAVGGILNWSLGLFLLAGAMNGNTGGIGFAMALYPGVHMLLISVMIWHRR